MQKSQFKLSNDFNNNYIILIIRRYAKILEPFCIVPHLFHIHQLASPRFHLPMPSMPGGTGDRLPTPNTGDDSHGPGVYV